MKKNYLDFVNELKSSTYISAGKKLKNLGHKERGESLINVGHEKKGYSNNDTIEYVDSNGVINSISVNDIIYKNGTSMNNLYDYYFYDKNNNLIISIKNNKITRYKRTNIPIIKTFIFDRKSAFRFWKYLKSINMHMDNITINKLYNKNPTIQQFEKLNFNKNNPSFLINDNIEYYNIISADRTNAGCDFVIHLEKNNNKIDILLSVCGNKDISILNYDGDYVPQLTENGIKIMKKYVNSALINKIDL